MPLRARCGNRLSQPVLYVRQTSFKGDQTATNNEKLGIRRAKPGQPSNAEPHIRQIAALEFSLFLEALRAKMYTTLASKTAQDEVGTKATASLWAKLKYVPPVDPDATPEDAAKVRRVADMVVEQLNIDPKEQIWIPANQKKKQDVAERAKRASQMLVYANLTAADPRQRAWAFNNSAHINLCNHNFRQSFELAKRAIDAASRVQASSPNLSAEMRRLQANAALTASIAGGRLGNSEAKIYKALAISDGSKKAVSIVIPTPTSPLSQVNECRPGAA